MTSIDDLPRRSFAIVGEYRQEILQDGDLKWIIGHGSNDPLALLHEMNATGDSIHDFIVSKFTPGGTFLDIGAHVGHYSVRAAHAGMNVYSVEANPETVQQLRLNCYLNKLNVTIWAFAAWDSRAIVEYHCIKDAKMRNGSASLMPVDGYEPMGIVVAAWPLDEVCERLPALDLIKMDVEGSDCHVLDGMMNTIIRHKPLLIFEDHSWTGQYDFTEMRARERKLEAFGYKWADATAHGVRCPDRYRVGTPGST